jgi:predicted dehydrogenase
MKNIRWGVIGSGRIASRFIDDLRFVEAASVSSIWSRNHTAATALAQQAGANVSDSLDALLNCDVDAVYIATLPDTHADFSIRTLQHNKAVLCEKPVATSAREAEAILAIAKASGMLYMEAMKPPFFPLMQSIERHLQQKPIGTVRFVHSGFCVPTPLDHSSWQANTGGGALAHIGIYHAWLAVNWLGAISSVSCAGRITAQAIDAFAACLTTHVGGGIGQFYCGLDLAASSGATIAAEHGTLILEERWWSPENALIRYHNGETVTLQEPYQGDGLHYEVAHFCDLLRSGATESPILTHNITRHGLTLLDHARKYLSL